MKPIVVLSLLIFLSACAEPEQTNTIVEATPPKKINMSTSQQTDIKQPVSSTLENNQWQKVTVKYFSFEGGFFGLISNNGNKLLPMNLPKEYQIDGTLLKVQGEKAKDMMTIQQWGVPFNLNKIELIKLGSGSKSNNSKGLY